MASSVGQGAARLIASLSVEKVAKTRGGEARREKAARQFPLPSGLAGRKETGCWAPHYPRAK